MTRGDQEKLSGIFARKKIAPVLGEADFMAWLKREHAGEQINEEIPETRIFVPEVDAIREAVCRAYKVAKGSLLKSRRGMANEPRNVAVYLSRQLRGDRLIKIGQDYNFAKYSSVSTIIERTKKQVGLDKEFKKRVEKLEAIIRSKSQEQT